MKKLRKQKKQRGGDGFLSGLQKRAEDLAGRVQEGAKDLGKEQKLDLNQQNKKQEK